MIIIHSHLEFSPFTCEARGYICNLKGKLVSHSETHILPPHFPTVHLARCFSLSLLQPKKAISTGGGGGNPLGRFSILNQCAPLDCTLPTASHVKGQVCCNILFESEYQVSHWSNVTPARLTAINRCCL